MPVNGGRVLVGVDSTTASVDVYEAGYVIGVVKISSGVSVSCVMVVSEERRDTESRDVSVGRRGSRRVSKEGSSENGIRRFPLPLPSGKDEVLATVSVVSDAVGAMDKVLDASRTISVGNILDADSDSGNSSVAETLVAPTETTV